MIVRSLLLLGLASAGLIPASFLGAAAAVAQSPTFVPGTGIGLVPPKGMATAKGFSGFEDAASGASILVNELPPEAYAQIASTLTPEAMAATGVKTSGPAVDWKVAGGQGRLIRGKQTAHGMEYRKWVLVAKGPATTALVSVQAPESKSAALPDAAIEAALKSVSLKAPPSVEDQVAALPFRVEDRAGFRVVRVLAGSSLLLTQGPNDVIKDASQPVVIVASALGAVGANDQKEREVLAAQAFASIAGVSDVSVVKEDWTDKGAVTWNRIEGRGTYRDSMEAVSTLQIMRFEKGGYLRVVSIMRTLDRDALVPRIEALAASVSPK